MGMRRFTILGLALSLFMGVGSPWWQPAVGAQAPAATRDAARSAVDEAAGREAVHDHDHEEDDVEEDAASGRARPARRRFDYSRYSDGPRRVPTAGGTSLARQQQLGLGTRAAASVVLQGRPHPRWVAAAGGEVGEHLLWPVQTGRFGRGFGYVRQTRPDKRHDGIDIVAAEGSTVRAVADGLVVYADNEVRGFGNVLMVVHPNGWVSLYAHLYRITVPAGYRVSAGERVGFVGNTGISHAPHLHFELRVDGRPANPLHLFQGRPWIDAYRTWQRQLATGTYRAPREHQTLPGSSRDPSGPDASQRRAPDAETPAVVEAPVVADRSSATDPAQVAARLLDAPVPRELREMATGRTFRNALWPLRGGDVRRGFRSATRGVELSAPRGTAVRAASDGLVAYAGPLRGLGDVVVLVHSNGWVSLYAKLGTTNVEIGQPIRRGEWLGELGRSPLHYRLVIDGDAVDPAPHLAQLPEGVRW